MRTRNCLSSQDHLGMDLQLLDVEMNGYLQRPILSMLSQPTSSNSSYMLGSSGIWTYAIITVQHGSLQGRSVPSDKLALLVEAIKANESWRLFAHCS